ncbi:NAD(P)H-dependent D-xylose reductase xyl1 [Penicillium argentinense]|uniref:NAD(P)H-dependent D-xylose reductase xyl1 n=1 Tax=Penicillium argentinense TaxID=1131581 RepID=A0A9W9KMT2_9EURO|nr:NAD(P)H-dependent D-xylose reductase xyl1 [Penicillium argentinense]KAJ5112589.1 NAD(P)H-dependent D-xylose reductase xyl1 [Penicillium argentinense]
MKSLSKEEINEVILQTSGTLGVARAINEGLIKREDLFIVSKLRNKFHDTDKVEPITRRQLQDWKIDYFDLFLMHFPISLEYVDMAVQYPPPTDPNSRPAAPRNFNGGLILDMLKYANIRSATLQIEHHPYLTQEQLVNWVQGLSKNYGKRPAQIVLRWATQRGIAVVPKSGNPQRLAQSLSVTDFDLGAGDLQSISAMNRNLRFNDPMKFGEPHPIFF